MLIKALLGALFLLPLVVGQVIAGTADSNSDAALDIPYEKFVLDNGLTLIIHEDHKAPIVAVNVWYHVGSKNEKTGKTGFAHLFEHLMFNGSENYNHDFFDPLERVGATDLNGTTNRDRTNYFENVPTSALDLVLWMESDRMGHLTGAIDQAKLDEQRGVVQNEKRQGDNQPYGKVFELITKNSFPDEHPYSWETIGSMDDLDAASLDDVHEWFKTYYGAANSVVVIAGDIDAETAKQKVESYFGDIPAGSPVTTHEVWVAKRTESKRIITQDRVPQARLYRSWNVPGWNTPDHTNLDLVSSILTSGKTSRLYKRLVYDEQIATDVAAYVWSGEIASNFVIQASVRSGGDFKQVENAVAEELKKFIAEGPTEKELQRVKTEYRADFVRGIERIGGFGGKSDILAMNQVYGNSPDFYKTTLAQVKDATKEVLLASANAWLSSGDLNIEVHPYTEYSTTESTVDRTKLPDTAEPPKATFPEFQKATLSNGLKIMLAEREAVPLVYFSLQVDAGYSADQFGEPGTARLAMDMLDEGTTSRSALEISEALAQLGADLGSSSNLDMSYVNLSTLKSKLDASLALYADVILNPSFPVEDFERLKKQQVAQIQREKASPVQMAVRVFPKLIYGEGHAYSNPFTGSGFEGTVAKISREDIQKFHQTWIRPNNATLVVVGATSMTELQPKLENLFKKWQRGDVPHKNIAEVAQKPMPVVYLIDKPGAEQSIIFAGHVAPPRSDPDDIALDSFNGILGGEFSSRINMNLREDKHWAYGAFSILFGARGQRPFIVYAPVQTDKTKESMQEVLKELSGILTTNPATADELSRIQKNRTLSLPGQWETIAAVGGSLNEIVRYDLPEDYFSTYADHVKSLNLNQISIAGKKLVHPDNLIWVVVGDRSKIESGIRELQLGDMKLIDSDGNPVM